MFFEEFPDLPNIDCENIVFELAKSQNDVDDDDDVIEKAGQEAIRVINAGIIVADSEDEEKDDCLTRHVKKRRIQTSDDEAETDKRASINVVTMQVLEKCKHSNIPIKAYIANGNNNNNNVYFYATCKLIENLDDGTGALIFHIPPFNKEGVDIKTLLKKRYGEDEEVAMHVDDTTNIYRFMTVTKARLNSYRISQVRSGNTGCVFKGGYTDSICIRANSSKGSNSRVPSDGSLCIDMPDSSYMLTASWRQTIIRKSIESKREFTLIFWDKHREKSIRVVRVNIVSYDRVNHCIELKKVDLGACMPPTDWWMSNSYVCTADTDIVDAKNKDGVFKVKSNRLFAEGLDKNTHNERFWLEFKCMLSVFKKKAEPVLAELVINIL